MKLNTNNIIKFAVMSIALSNDCFAIRERLEQGRHLRCNSDVPNLSTALGKISERVLAAINLAEPKYGIGIPKKGLLNLNNTEAASIRGYTEKVAIPLNALLRGQTIYGTEPPLSEDRVAKIKLYSKKVREYVGVLDEAVRKLDGYNGEVYRGMYVPKTDHKFRAQLMGLDPIVDPAYVSTSANPNQAFKGNFHLRIQSNFVGKSIKDISALPDQDEVIFPRNTQFVKVNGGCRPIKIAKDKENETHYECFLSALPPKKQ